MMRTALVAASIVALAACSTSKQPLALNQVPVEAGRTTQQVETAILESLQQRGWTVEERTPGRIVAKIDVRAKHSATVAITYDQRTYSINYVDSSGLDYNAKRGTIHRNYNRWVNNLHADIAAKI